MINFLSSEIQTTPLIILTVALIGVIILLAIFLDTDKRGFNTKMIAFAGISIALSVALSLIKLFALPQGGTVTLASLLPILLFSYIYGTKKGILIGTIVGLLCFFIDPYIVHPAQFLLDYPVAFASIGLCGAFSKFGAIRKIPWLDFALGAVFAGILRFLCHTFSGVFAFSEFATSDVWIYSLTYNSFVFVDIGISIAVGVLAMFSKPFLRLILLMKNPTEKTSDKNPPENVSDGSENIVNDNKKEDDSHA